MLVEGRSLSQCLDLQTPRMEAGLESQATKVLTRTKRFRGQPGGRLESSRLHPLSVDHRPGSNPETTSNPWSLWMRDCRRLLKE